MTKIGYQYFEAPTVESKQYKQSEILVIIQRGFTFYGYVRIVDKETGFISSFEFVELWWDETSKRVRGISGFSVFDSTEGQFIEGSCSVPSFRNNNHSLALFSDNRHGSKYQKQLVAQKLIYPPTHTREVYYRQRVFPIFKKIKDVG